MGQILAFIRLLPELWRIATTLYKAGNDIAFELALRSALTSIGNAFEEIDPQKRAKRLNDVFRNS